MSERSAGLGTRRALVGLALLAIAWGLGLGSRPVLAFGAALGSVLIALGLFPRLVTLRARREMVDRASEDDDVAVSFRVWNPTALPLAWVVVEDRFTPDRSTAKSVLAGSLLGPRRGAVARYAGNCFGKRGVYAIGPAHARLHDPLGLFPRDVPLGGTSPLVVLPTVVELPPLPSGGTGFPLAGGPRSLRVAGSSTLALGVREWRAGDALRRVHWPTTARRGKLMMVEYELDAGGDVTVFLDLSRSALRGLGRRSTLEMSVRIAASAIAQYARRGERVGLVARGKQPIELPPSAGELHVARALEMLAHVRPDGETPQDVVLREAAAQVPFGSTAFVIVANLQLGVDRVVGALAHLRARGVSVVAVLLDDASFLRIFDEQATRPEETVRLTACADALLAEGATVFTVAQGDDLAARFAQPYAGPTRIKIDLAALTAEGAPPPQAVGEGRVAPHSGGRGA